MFAVKTVTSDRVRRGVAAGPMRIEDRTKAGRIRSRKSVRNYEIRYFTYSKVRLRLARRHGEQALHSSKRSTMRALEKDAHMPKLVVGGCTLQTRASLARARLRGVCLGCASNSFASLRDLIV